MKLTTALLALIENASADYRTNDDTAYGDIVFSGCQLERLYVCSNQDFRERRNNLFPFSTI